jgi:hypothetical protein
LCCLNTKTKEVQWSGAYNSLWYIREGILYEIDADKQPIGKNDKPTPFNTHNLKIQKDDILYYILMASQTNLDAQKVKNFISKR